MIKQRHFSQSQQIQMGRLAIEHIGPIADRLEAFVSELFDQGTIPYTPDNGADNMALTFIAKQREHLRSVRILIDAEAHRDALLIARTMVEGSGRLRWAFKKTPERTELWLWFGAIRDWRQIQKNIANGLSVDPKEVAELRQIVDTHGHNYYRRQVRSGIDKAKKHGRKYMLPSDPWGNSWTETSVKAMFDELKDTDTYDLVYRQSSEWVHWDPRSVFRTMDMGPSGAKGFTNPDWRAGGLAFPLACHSLLQCLQVLDAHFSLGLEDRLKDLNAQLIAILNQSVEATLGDANRSHGFRLSPGIP